MKISAFIFVILMSGAFGFELESAKDEAVFQGKCNLNLCAQLCYELHDGMFECECTRGYELKPDGYSCKPINISNDFSYNESTKYDDDYSTSDIFYQKGVSFSATLDDSNEHNIIRESEIVKNDVDNQRSNDSINTVRSTPKPAANVSVNIPRFHQTSWLAFRPLKGANLVTEITIEFRPELSNGILLLSGEREDLNGDFMIVTISNGFIEFLFDCGSGKGVIKSNDKVVLHQWNTLTIYRYRWDAWIELNEKRRVRGRSTGIFSRITFRSPVYLGGKGNITSETLFKKKIHTTKGFSGCIRKFVVNGHQFELFKLSSGEIISTLNLNECVIDQCSYVKCLHGGRCQSSTSSCLCPLGFGGKFCEEKLDLKVPKFNGTSNLRYSPLGETAIIWLEIKLVIMPQSEDGLILYSGKNDMKDFISLHLNFGYVEFQYDLGSGVTTVRSKLPVAINQWHSIKVSRTARLAVMKVDNQPEVMSISPNGFWHLSLPYSLYLGGVSKVNSLPSNLRDRGFFIGCIKQFDVNDRTVELIDDALGGFSISNCNDTCFEEYLPSMHEMELQQLETSTAMQDEGEHAADESENLIPRGKYAFDVVDDSSDERMEASNDEEKAEIGTLTNTDEDAIHKRIVRVSLQKTSKSQLCFKGNESYALYDFGRLIKATDKYQNRVNIRFKTSSPNGLMFLIVQKITNHMNSYFSLSIEDGFMHLRYNQASTHIDIKFNGTKVDDNLWHRVRASRNNQKGSLRIDGGKAVMFRMRAKRKLFHASPGLYLGGTSNSSLQGFNGCISDVILNSEGGEHHLDLNIFRMEGALNVNLDEKL